MSARMALIVAVAQLAATAAQADPVEDRALAHLDHGVAAFRAGDFARARLEIAEAQRLAPDRPNPYRWLAKTDAELGDCRSALTHIERFLARVPASDPRVAEVIAVRDRCTAEAPLEVSAMGVTYARYALVAERADRPVHRRWWLWAAAGAVVVTAAGVTYALTRDGEARLPPVICDAGGCHP